MKDIAGHCRFTVGESDPSEIGFALDSEYDISVRVGMHCAPSAHKTLGTWPRGTVRVSPGYFNTEKDIEIFIEALRNIVNK